MEKLIIFLFALLTFVIGENSVPCLQSETTTKIKAPSAVRLVDLGTDNQSATTTTGSSNLNSGSSFITPFLTGSLSDPTPVISGVQTNFRNSASSHPDVSANSSIHTISTTSSNFSNGNLSAANHPSSYTYSGIAMTISANIVITLASWVLIVMIE